jgi:hypothetical protein
VLADEIGGYREVFLSTGREAVEEADLQDPVRVDRLGRPMEETVCNGPLFDVWKESCWLLRGSVSVSVSVQGYEVLRCSCHF